MLITVFFIDGKSEVGIATQHGHYNSEPLEIPDTEVIVDPYGDIKECCECYR
jgi:hypothetical protein